jgi:hypothetical protein
MNYNELAKAFFSYVLLFCFLTTWRWSAVFVKFSHQQKNKTDSKRDEDEEAVA